MAREVTKDEQRRIYNEKREIAELRTVFDTLDTDGNGKIEFKELHSMLVKLEYKCNRQEVEDMIWEVDENGDKAVDWEEFTLMFARARADTTGYEPRKLYNIVEFMMHDKDGGGTIDMDECMEILYRRCGMEDLEKRTNAYFKPSEGNTEITLTEYLEGMAGDSESQSGRKGRKGRASSSRGSSRR